MGNSKSKHKVAYGDKRNTNLSKDDNICVIGAGPAGIHMSSLLVKHGYKKITILEISDRIGGKSFTIRDKDDVPHEMGTCYLHPKYDIIRNLLKEYNVGKEVEIANGKNVRNMFKTHLSDKNHEIDEKGTDFMDWFLDKTEERILPEKLRDWIPDELSVIPLKIAVSKYNKVHKKIFGYYKYTLPPKPNNFEDLNMTFLQFLEKHGLQSLIPMLTYSLSVQGYGIIDTIPAFYGMYWITPELLSKIFDIGRQIKGKPSVTMLYDGFQNLWETIAKKHNLNIIFNCNITKIKRNGQICICRDNKLDLIFDHLIIAANNKDIIKLLEQPTQNEINIFQKLTHFTFTTTLYESDIPKEVESAVEIWPHILWKANGHMFAHRHSKTAVRPSSSPHRSCIPCKSVNIKVTTNRERAVAYQFADRDPTAYDNVKQQQILLKDLNSYAQESNINILHQNVWKYFPHFNQLEINNAYPWKIIEMQGSNRTWYIGSSVSFESVLDVTSYNLMLLEMFNIL